MIQGQGSHSKEVQYLAETLLREVRTVPFICARHISGAHNVAADALSRDHVVPGEWELTKETFLLLQSQVVTGGDSVVTHNTGRR